jgi:hypothetical protein
MEFVYAYTDLEEYTTDTSRSESPTNNNNSTPEIFFTIWNNISFLFNSYNINIISNKNSEKISL